MAYIPPCPDPLPDAAPIERMQAGGFNWRGGEGSVTDRVAEDQREEDPVTYQAGEPLIFSAYTRPSTGLIYMQARYYEPETGRFTQSDPLPYDLGQSLYGQNNRWVYCGSDPVNCSDPSGLGPLGVLAVIAEAIARIVGGPVGGMLFAIARLLSGLDAANVTSAEIGCLLRLAIVQLRAAIQALGGGLLRAAQAMLRILMGALGGVIGTIGGAGVAGLGVIALTLILGALVLNAGLSLVLYYQFYVWQALNDTGYSSTRGGKRKRTPACPGLEAVYASIPASCEEWELIGNVSNIGFSKPLGEVAMRFRVLVPA